MAITIDSRQLAVMEALSEKSREVGAAGSVRVAEVAELEGAPRGAGVLAATIGRRWPDDGPSAEGWRATVWLRPTGEIILVSGAETDEEEAELRGCEAAVDR